MENRESWSPVFQLSSGAAGAEEVAGESAPGLAVVWLKEDCLNYLSGMKIYIFPPNSWGGPKAKN